MACDGEEAAGTLDAGNTPRMPLPVPKLAGCGGMSTLLVSVALATTAFEVSAASARCGIALVIDGAGCDGPAAASFIAPALTWTVLTLTGFIGSAEPGIAEIGWVLITPLVNGAGSGLASALISGLAWGLAGSGGRAAAAAAISDALAAGRVAAGAGAVTGSAAATTAPLACTLSVGREAGVSASAISVLASAVLRSVMAVAVRV